MLIKRIILTSLCLFFVFISKGQENKNSYEIAIGIAKVTDKHFDSPNVNVNFTYNRLLYRQLWLGAGLGYNYLYTGAVGVNNNLYSSFPIYADVRFIHSISNITKLLLVIDGGIMINENDDSSSIKPVTGYFSPQVGFNFRISQSGTAIGVRLFYKRFTSFDLNSIGGQISINF